METPLVKPRLAAQKDLNRRSEKRGDASYISEALSNPKARILAMADLKVPILPEGAPPHAGIRWMNRAEIETISRPANYVFLGEDDFGVPVFACNFLPDTTTPHQAEFDAWKPLVDLRSLAIQGVLRDEELLIASQARAILGWHAIHRCCSRCGAQTEILDGGWRRQCSACGLDTFPRTDPVVIMLVTYGGRCLLGHEHRFPDKFYSTLAGYVEPGDDVEHAVRREIKEEAGIEVGQVHYVASQPWPFPHSLMIGCWGEAFGDKLTIDTNELRDARWFAREEVAAMLAATHPEQLTTPPPISMAHTLLRGFVDGAIG